MILRVILKNFLSFDDEVQFDMFPNFKKTSLTNHIYKVSDNAAVLKMAAIYGANGAGKTNLLKGINVLKWITTIKQYIDKDNVMQLFYGLKADVAENPMELGVEFVTKGGVPFIYSVAISKEGITSESLYVSGLGVKENKMVFERKGTCIKYDVQPSPELADMIVAWVKMNPFSSLFTINNDMPVLRDRNIANAYMWFSTELLVLDIHSLNQTLITSLKTNEEMRNFASEFLRAIDLGVSDVKVETENFEDWAVKNNVSNEYRESVRNMPRDGILNGVFNFRNMYDISIENGIQKISRLLFEQFGKNGYSTNMDINAQSDGTVRLLSLIPSLYAAVKTKSTVIIDEIDHSIHPHLVRNMVRYFSKKDTKGQLIFTTHQTCLLNQEFIRTDEVWMAEKHEGSTKIYSLNDFNIHHTKNIENGYLEGRYSAIPFIGEFNF